MVVFVAVGWDEREMKQLSEGGGGGIHVGASWRRVNGQRDHATSSAAAAHSPAAFIAALIFS